MTLTTLLAKNTPASEKQRKVYDKDGLYLLIKPTGRKYWRFKYRYAGKEKSLALGVFPEVSLTEARKKTQQARLELREGIDPCQKRQMEKAQKKVAHANTFKAIANAWYEREKSSMKPATNKKRRWMLENYLYPAFGNMPVSEITPPKLIRAFRQIEAKGTLETAKRAKVVSSQVFSQAVIEGYCSHNPTRDLENALARRKTKHHPAILDPKELGKMLKKFDYYQGTPTGKALLKISPYLFQRPGEIRQMEWREINLDACQWEMPEGPKYKSGEAKIIPLSTQVMDIILDMYVLNADSNYVFPSSRNAQQPASDGTVSSALKKLGYRGKQTAHGFRSIGRTLLDEVLEYPPHIIEQQINHTVRDPLGRAYNRTKHLKQRTEMMQAWADYLDALKHADEQKQRKIA